MAFPFDDVLGLGFAGFAKIDDVFLMLNASSAIEEDNLMKSAGAVSTVISRAAGQTPVRDRRGLSLTLSSDLTPLTADLIARTMYDWRRSNLLGNTHEVEVSIAGGEGYTTTEGYVESVSMSSPQGALCSVSFTIRSWSWTDTTGVELQREASAFLPFNDPNFQPIPNWDTEVEFDAQPGECLEFQLDLDNNWFFGELLEGTRLPPTPRFISAGPLILNFTYTTLAKKGERPAESGSPKITLGGSPSLGANPAVPEKVIEIPLVYRDPSRQLMSFGEQNGVVRWQASWQALGVIPD